MEDYLEALLNIFEKKNIIRVKDIAFEMNVKMPTVNKMLNSLSEKEYIIYTKYEDIKLTAKGINSAKSIKYRHNTIKNFLEDYLLIDKQTAEEEACLMEHCLSDKSLKRISCLMTFLCTINDNNEGWQNEFQKHINHS